MPVEKKTEPKPKKAPVKKAPAKKTKKAPTQKQSQKQTINIHLAAPAKSAKPRKSASKAVSKPQTTQAATPHIYAPQTTQQPIDYMRISELVKPVIPVMKPALPVDFLPATKPASPVKPTKPASPAKTADTTPAKAKPEFVKPKLQREDSAVSDITDIMYDAPIIPDTRTTIRVPVSKLKPPAVPREMRPPAILDTKFDYLFEEPGEEHIARKKLQERISKKEDANMKEPL